jgi:predicted CXXCH cytochrome family protein
LKKFAHEPFVRGQCTVCHQPHEADNRMLLRGGEGARHCFTCHDGLKNAMLAATYVHKPVTQDCNTCHEPHSTDHPRQLRTSIEQNCYSCHEQIRKHVETSTVHHAAVTTANTCANCHNPHASQHKDLLRQRMDQTCLSCHDKPLVAADGHTIPNMKPVIAGSRFLHGPIRSGDCSGCHDPHGARFPNLLDAAFPKTFYARFDLGRYQLCFNCHDSAMVLQPRTTSLTNFRDGDVNLHYVHVNRDDKGRSCKTCHAVHGSNLPNHMASQVPFEGSSWAMPIEFEKRPEGGACSPGCHVPRTYTPGPTTAPATMPMSNLTRGVE